MYGNIEMLIAFLFSVRSHIYSYMKEVWAYIFEEVEYYFFKAIRSIIALVAVPTMFVIFFFIVAPAVAMYVKSQEILPRKYRTHIEQK